MQTTIAMQSEVTGQGKPLVLVPGGLTGWISWKPHAERLAQIRKVVRVQPLNVDMGLRRERLPGDYSVGLEARALEVALDKEGIQEADFAAWSYGAEVTLSFAISNPQRVRSLTLIEPPAFWVLRSRGVFTPDLAERQKQLVAMWRIDVTEDQLAWFTHFAGFVPAQADPKTVPQWQGWLACRQSLAHGDATYAHQDDIGKVRKFSKPVLLFKSRDSSDFLVRIVEILGEEFPGAVVHDLPGGHAMHLMHMDKFLGLFTPFLESA